MSKLQTSGLDALRVWEPLTPITGPNGPAVPEKHRGRVGGGAQEPRGGSPGPILLSAPGAVTGVPATCTEDEWAAGHRSQVAAPRGQSCFLPLVRLLVCPPPETDSSSPTSDLHCFLDQFPRKRP